MILKRRAWSRVLCSSLMEGLDRIADNTSHKASNWKRAKRIWLLGLDFRPLMPRGGKSTGTVETSGVFKRGTVNTSPAPLSWEFPESSIFLAPNFNSENKNNDRLVIAEDCGEEK